MTARSDPIDALIERCSPRAGSLIITVFGDAIAPRSGDIWLGSLITMMAQLGLSERLVRTGVYRLARDGWLHSRSRGRKSYYALTEAGRMTFAEAEARIYASSAPEWDGTWTLVQALPGMNAAQRKKMRETLKWHGYGQLSQTLMVRPQRTGESSTISAIDDVAGAGKVAIFTASQPQRFGAATLHDTAQAAWNLSALNSAYLNFLHNFAEMESSLPWRPDEAFPVRSLLIHEYRRILLQDPQLPEALLPTDWAGTRARVFARSLYRALREPADDYIASTLENWDGTVPPIKPDAIQRFA